MHRKTLVKIYLNMLRYEFCRLRILLLVGRFYPHLAAINTTYIHTCSCWFKCVLSMHIAINMLNYYAHVFMYRKLRCSMIIRSHRYGHHKYSTIGTWHPTTYPHDDGTNEIDGASTAESLQKSSIPIIIVFAHFLFFAWKPPQSVPVYRRSLHHRTYIIFTFHSTETIFGMNVIICWFEATGNGKYITSHYIDHTYLYQSYIFLKLNPHMHWLAMDRRWNLQTNGIKLHVMVMLGIGIYKIIGANHVQ